MLDIIFVLLVGPAMFTLFVAIAVVVGLAGLSIVLKVLRLLGFQL